MLRIHGAAAKSSVTASVQMIQTILILVERQQTLSFFPPAFKVCVWIYLVAKLGTFQNFTVSPRDCELEKALRGRKTATSNFIFCLSSLLAMSRDSTRVYVGDLGSGGSKPELEREFERYGPLKSVWVARNPPGEKGGLSTPWMTVLNTKRTNFTGPFPC